jgi:hypothetical protein
VLRLRHIFIVYSVCLREAHSTNYRQQAGAYWLKARERVANYWVIVAVIWRLMSFSHIVGHLSEEHDKYFIGLLQPEDGRNSVRFEVFTAVTMKNAIYCDIKTQFVPHRRHIKTPLQISAG